MNELSVRIGTLTRIVQKRPNLGRTALMKYCYFLQTLRGVRLGYNFRLYSYGPFDADVLADLDSAEGVGSLKSEVKFYSGGYGYRIEPGEKAEAARQWASQFLTRHDADIDWVLERFGMLSAPDLELYSTVVYCDREAGRKGERVRVEELIRRVHDVKPHFTEDYIAEAIQRLEGLKVLGAIDRAV